jgi:hypothetical protein
VALRVVGVSGVLFDPFYRRSRRWRSGRGNGGQRASWGAINGAPAACGRRGAAVARAPRCRTWGLCWHRGREATAHAAGQSASGGRRGTRGTERARARTARRGASDGRRGAAHGHELRVRVRHGAAGQSRRTAGQCSGARQRKEGRGRREEGERRKKGRKREKGEERKRKKERKREKERLGKKEKKRNGKREKKKERERGGASVPIAAATAAGRPRVRHSRAARGERDCVGADCGKRSRAVVGPPSGAG